MWPGILVLILWTKPDGWIEKVWPVDIVLNSSECLAYGAAYLKAHEQEAKWLIEDNDSPHIVCVSANQSSTATQR